MGPADLPQLARLRPHRVGNAAWWRLLRCRHHDLWFTPFAGVLADRLPRRTILWTSSLFGAATAAAVALLIVADLIEVWHAYAFALITGVAQAVNQPARQAAVYDTATPGTLQNAVALNSLAQNLARIVGPAAAGVIAVWSLTVAFLLIALMRAFAALATYLMAHRPATQRAGARRNPLADILEGFRYLASDARLAGLWLVNSLPSLVVYPYVALLPVFADEVFNAGSRGYGVIVTMVGIGSAIGLIILAVATNLRRRGMLMMAGFLLYLLTARSPSPSPRRRQRPIEAIVPHDPHDQPTLPLRPRARVAGWLTFAYHRAR